MSLEICPTAPLKCSCGNEHFYVNNTWTTGAPLGGGKWLEPQYGLNVYCTQCGNEWNTKLSFERENAILEGPRSKLDHPCHPTIDSWMEYYRTFYPMLRTSK